MPCAAAQAAQKNLTKTNMYNVKCAAAQAAQKWRKNGRGG